MKKILIIEDDKLVRSSLATRLATSDFKVTTCMTGEEGLEIVKVVAFDAIIVDINLPGINGVQAIEEIRKTPLNSKTLILIFSNSDYMEYVEKAMKNDVVVYLTKSDKDLEEVVKIIKEKLKI